MRPTTRRHTTRQEDAQFILRRLADARRSWNVGDACMAFGWPSRETTVDSIEGDIVTLATGDQLHVSKMRSVVRS